MSGHVAQSLPQKISVIICNGLLIVNVRKKSPVEIITFTLHGKVVSTVQKTMDVGTHTLPLPHCGTGIYLSRIKSDRCELIIKSSSIGGSSQRTIVSAYGSPSQNVATQEKSFDPINDVIAVAKEGYLNYEVTVTNSDTSGIEIRMIVCEDTVTDADGNVYQAVKIGNQVWTVENLRTSKYRDGSDIPLVTDDAAWSSLITPGYCYYNNTTDADYIRKFGALYNWYTVDTKKLAPAGWHVPSNDEWNTLINYLVANGYNWDGTTAENKVGKSVSARTDWNTSTFTGAVGNDLTMNNRSGLSYLPAGCRFYDSSFNHFGNYGVWWCTDEFLSSAHYSVASFESEYLNMVVIDKSSALSVRLLRDN